MTRRIIIPALLMTLLATAVLLVAAVYAQPVAPGVAPVAQSQTGQPDGQPDTPELITGPTACSVPTTATVRGKSVNFDQCYETTFSRGATNYTVHVFYTEANSATNLAQCTAAENSANRCEHALSNNDDANGDNVNAVAMADEAADALDFYLERNLQTISGTTLNVYIAEDPRLGGVIWPNSIYVDDDAIDNNDQLQKRLLAYHEVQHLVQDKYDALTGWIDFWGEGVARAIEDRVDPALDADTGHLFIPEVSGILGNNSQRASDISTINYRSVLWWVWLMDQYRTGSETEPVQGWVALRDFYTELNTESDQLKALRDFITAKGSTFRSDFIDYTLSLFAYRFNPSDARLTYLDNEIRTATSGLSGHTVLTTAPAFSTSSVSMNPRSSRYVEFNPASQCDYVAFSFDGNGTRYGFSVMTTDSGSLQKRWTSYSTGWSRTVRSADLDRVVGVVTAIDDSGTVDIGRGCVTPTLQIKNPTSSAIEMVGTAVNPRKFITRLKVTGADGSAVAGLLASDFTVELQQAGGGPVIPANIINSTYVQDDYWLLVQAPNDAAGAQTGQFYNLTVRLGSQSDTENSAVLYVERTQDVVIVLDRSGSMSFASGKIQAARNAAALLVNELADNDQGAYVAFDTDADLRVGMDALGSGSQRTDLEIAIANEVPLDFTSIGDGMLLAADEEDARGIATNMCSFILLSDGYENEPEMWADVRSDVVDNGCAIHTIALGPQSNETLMQQISASVPGGSHDYADVSGSVPILAQLNAQGIESAAAPSVAPLGWENNLSRIYDAKATQIAGRQRLQTAVSPGRDQQEQKYEIFVDDTTAELVVSVAWQNPTKGEHVIELFDPDGNLVTPDSRRFSPLNTNEVLRVERPQPGVWTILVANLFQEYFLSATAQSQYEMYLFVGTPAESLTQGVQVPLLVTFVGPEKPLTGAQVIATVRAPNGLLKQIMLYDDGDHGDGEPEDGVYGGVYTATAAADAALPEKVFEGEEPNDVGSYLVTAVGTKDDLRREAQASFTVQPGKDENGNRLPDDWEREYGVDDPNDDPDGDNLTTGCEFQLGTNPVNPDTDSGGESDGSEVPGCKPDPNGQDPLDPSDDRVGPITGIFVKPELLRTIPVIHVKWGSPLRGRLQYVNIYRRVFGPGGQLEQDWQFLKEAVEGDEFIDDDVEPGFGFQYRVVPFIQGEDGRTIVIGGILESPVGLPSGDPYAPSGSILINNGDEATTSRQVTLTFSADDLNAEHDGDNSQHPGSPVDKLEMRISNRADFAGSDWQPFQGEVSGWDLGSVAPGAVATVHVQFRDEAGNVSEVGLGLTDTIVYAPEMQEHILYLPVVIR